MLTYDATTNYGSAALVGFIHSEYWAEKSRDERRIAVIDDLVKFFGDDARHIIDYEEKDWQMEPFTGGCPVACLPTGNMDALLRIREPIDRYTIQDFDDLIGYMLHFQNSYCWHRIGNTLAWIHVRCRSVRTTCSTRNLMEYATDIGRQIAARWIRICGRLSTTGATNTSQIVNIHVICKATNDICRDCRWLLRNR